MPRKTLKQRKQKNSNRIQPILSEIYGTEKPDTMMNILLTALRETELNIPRPGDFVAFIYNATTPRLLYDRHPIVAVYELAEWGFKGVNLHTGEPRNYDFRNTQGAYYAIKKEELDDALTLPTMLLVQNR